MTAIQYTIRDHVKQRNLIWKMHKLGKLEFKDIGRRLGLSEATIHKYYREVSRWRSDYNKWQNLDSLAQLNIPVAAFRKITRCQGQYYISDLKNLNKLELYATLGSFISDKYIEQIIDAIKIKYPNSKVDSIPEDSICNLNLSSAVMKIMVCYDILTISKLQEMSDEELLSLNKLGLCGLQEIKTCLNSYQERRN